jgi:hypothetical protein
MITPSFGLTATERVLPRLALDFTTASLDSRVTFARTGATATRVNSSGFIETVAADTPRFDFDPVTLNCKGLLIEEARTNICLKSDDFSTTWSYVSSGTTSPSVVANQAISPDGTLNADEVTFGAITGSAQFSLMRQAITVSAITYTSSIYVKAKDSNEVGKKLFFYLNSGAVNVLEVTLSLNWTRINVSQLAVAGSGNITIGTGGSGVFTGGGNQTAVVAHIYGAQLEAGAFVTSYIPTGNTSVVRNPDVATMTGTNFSDWYNTGVGGLAALVLPSTVSGTRPAIQFDDNTTDEIITLRGDTTNPELVIVEGGAGQAQIDAGTIAANTVYNLGAAWATDDCAASVNGNAAVTDTTATIPTVTQARLGSDGTNYLNGHLQSIRYWPQRIIDAEVRAFSK